MSHPIRFARQVLFLDPDDCVPPHGLDLTTGSRDAQKVDFLTFAFKTEGFDPKEPALVGYPDGAGKVQLLSGTHRHEAARRANIRLPVKMVMRSSVEAAWGLDDWARVIADIPVEDLLWAPVGEPQSPPGIDERIDLRRDYVNDEVP